MKQFSIQILRHGALFLTLWASMTTAQAQAPSIRATVDTANPVEGDDIQYTLTITMRDAGQNIQYQFPEVDGLLRDTDVTRTGTQTSVVNGMITQSRTFATIYTAEKAGRIVIPRPVVRVGGQTYYGNQISLNVRGADQSGLPATLIKEGILPAQFSGQRLLTDRSMLFLRPVVSKLNPYVREPVVVTFYAYVDPVISQNRLFGGLELGAWTPDEKTFIVKIIYDAQTSGGQLTATEETIDNRSYLRFPLLKCTLAPQHAGAFTLPSFQAVIRLTQGIMTRQNASMRTRPLPLTVRPLPTAGRPADFEGAVGDYKISAKVDKNIVKENDIVNYTIIIEGVGDLTTIPNPSLGEIPGFDVFESQAEVIPDITDQRHGGRKRIEIALQPTQPGKLTIPAVTYTFFNPTQDAYQTIQSNPIPLTVQVDPNRNQGIYTIESAQLPVNGDNPKARTLRKQVNISTIKTDTDHDFRPRKPFAGSGLFWLLQIPPVLLLLSAGAYGARRRRFETDTAFARSARAKDRASQRLKTAALAMKDNRTEDFYAEAAVALRGLVADRMALATAGATNGELREAVKTKTSDDDLAEALYRFLETSDAVRYAPSTAPDIDAHWTEANRLIRILEKKL